MTWKEEIKKAPLPPDGDPTDPNVLPRSIKDQIKAAIQDFNKMELVDNKANHELKRDGLRKLYRLLKHLDDPEKY